MMLWKTEAERNGRQFELMKCTSLIEGDVMPGLVVGCVSDLYCGREVVRVKHPAGIFGTTCGKSRDVVREKFLTLHNGIVNHCVLKEKPTPYWAMLDATIDLHTGFRRRDVLAKAVALVGESQRRACEMAWEILRNHHRHDRKKESGMGFMLDSMKDGTLKVRSRGADETMQFFACQTERRKTAEQLLGK